MVKHGLNAERDVFFVDQRGTHHAEPLLACPEWEQYIYDAVSLPFAADATAAIAAATAKACRDRLAATGADLAAYNTTENAADIAELRVALGIDTLECLRCLLRIETRAVRAARSPAGHPQRRARFGIAAQQQHRRDVVVGAGQFVQGDLRRVCGAAHLRRGLPDAGGGLHGHGQPPRRNAGRHAAHRPVRRAGDGQHRRLRLLLHTDHGERARRWLGHPQDDGRHGTRRRRLGRCQVPGVSGCAAVHRLGRPRPWPSPCSARSTPI